MHRAQADDAEPQGRVASEVEPPRSTTLTREEVLSLLADHAADPGLRRVLQELGDDTDDLKLDG